MPHAGQPCPESSGSGTADAKIDWCGGFYSWEDVKDALHTLCSPHQSFDQPDKQAQNTDEVVRQSSQDQSSVTGLHQDGSQRLSSGLDSEPILHPSQGMSQAAHEGETGQEQSLDQLLGEGRHPAHQDDDPWLPSSWSVLGGAAQALLNGLAEAEAIPWVCQVLPAPAPALPCPALPAPAFNGV